jgi:hypothetical protein
MRLFLPYFLTIRSLAPLLSDAHITLNFLKTRLMKFNQANLDIPPPSRRSRKPVVFRQVFSLFSEAGQNVDLRISRESTPSAPGLNFVICSLA